MAEGVVFGNGFWVWYSVSFGAGGGRGPVNGVEEEGDS